MPSSHLCIARLDATPDGHVHLRVVAAGIGRGNAARLAVHLQQSADTSVIVGSPRLRTASVRLPPPLAERDGPRVVVDILIAAGDGDFGAVAYPFLPG